MVYYRQVGEVPPKRHTQFRKPDGGLYAEELVSQYGFSGASSLLYHRHPPTALLETPGHARPTAPDVPDTLRTPDVAGTGGGDDTPGRADATDNHPLMPYHLHTEDAAARAGAIDSPADAVTGRRLLLANQDVRISVAAVGADSPLYRNASGDELVYVRSGQLRLESTFGALDCGPGDYVLIPTGTVHRWLARGGDHPPAAAGPERAQMLILEATGHVAPPSRYLSPRGQFLEHSPFCERDLHGPDEPLLATDDGPADVLVARGGRLSRHRLAHHPFDVVGWDGSIYPYRFSVYDFEPITGRVHQPPPVHQTFEGPGFVVCSFVPRKLDYHPDAVPAPYNHANVDSDEVLYYCEGDFTSRRGVGIAAGSLTLHPAGHVHGPQPGSVEASLGADRTDELAVMVDTFRPLGLTAAARACADADYPLSWATGQPAGGPAT